ncbi:MAG: hypothetical protein WBF34_04710 [Streptosporangiaceae bacterium]|jgi:hypothetical protein
MCRTCGQIQQQYTLTPLSLWGTGREVPEQRDVLKPVELTADPLGPWRTLNAMLAENPLPAWRMTRPRPST